jgi:hypothetical protein
MKRPPIHFNLYASCLRNSNQPRSRIDLFKPRLRLAPPNAPAFSEVGDCDIPDTFKSSTQTTAWLWLELVEILCR